MKEINEHIKKSLLSISAYDDSTRYHEVIDPQSGKTKHVQPEGKYDDSLSNANHELKKYLLETLPQVPQSLTSTIPSYDGYLFRVKTSSDKQFREWSWDTRMGGTMPTIWKIFQFKTPKGIKAYDPINERGLSNHSCDTIFSVLGKNDVKYYLAVESWIGDTRHCGKTISAFTINDTVLKFKIKLFKKKNELVRELTIYYPEDMVTWEETQAHNFNVKDNGRTLLVPFIEDGEMTSNYLFYKFDGEHFVYQGVK